MAIDDNASYELTGAQVKDLANKIKAKAADNIFVGATSAAPGSKGLVPQPQAGDDTKFLKGDGTWATIDDNHAELYLNGTLWDSADISGWNGHIYTDASFTNMLTVSEFESLFMDSNPTDVWIWLPPHGDSTQAVLRLITKEVSDLNYPAYAATFIWSDTNGRQVIYTFYPDENGDGTTDFSVDRYELQQLLTAGSNITINDTTISATDTTYSAFGGATTQVAGSAGLVPAPTTSDADKFLKGDGTWQSIAGNYSTAEQDTGTTWIDGKPIYKKTINFGALPNAAAKHVDHNISNLGHFVATRGVAWTASKACVELPFASPSQLTSAISLLATSTGIDITAGVDRSEFSNCYVTLWYTKTTN